jgi:hypothetical protein
MNTSIFHIGDEFYRLHIQDSQECLEMAYSITNFILDNISQPHDYEHNIVFQFQTTNVELIANITKNNFIPILEANLQHFIRFEQYEMCSKIRDSIIYLKNMEKNLSV